MGLESQGMMLFVEDDEGAYRKVQPAQKVKEGTRVK